MAITSSSKIKEILESPEAMAIVRKYFPGIDDPRIKQGARMKLKSLMAFPQSKVSKENASACAQELDGAGIE